MQTHEGLVIINHESVVLLISEYWPDEYLISGQENVKNIVEDVLVGSASEKNFIAPPVGDSFDITFDLETILAAAQLIVAVYQVLQDNRQKRAQSDYIISETEMETIVENYINATNSKAWEILNDNQKADFIDALLKFRKA